MKIFQIIHWLTKLFKLNNKSKVILFILMPLGILAQNNAAFWLGKRASAGETDPYFANVSLLLHMDGANGSTTFTDNSNNNYTVTANGNAQISTAQSKFGGASGYFDGNNDFLSIPSNTSNAIGTGNWTIETWIYTQTTSGSRGIVGMSIVSLNQGIIIRQDGAKIRYWVNGYQNIITSSSNIAANTWYHIALVRNGGTTTLYINGVANATSNITPVFGTNTNYVIGKTYTNYDLEGFLGYIDDLRITKGIARYTSNFTPPTAPFPNN